jgi:hypothetical protein
MLLSSEQHRSVAMQAGWSGCRRQQTLMLRLVKVPGIIAWMVILEHSLTCCSASLTAGDTSACSVFLNDLQQYQPFSAFRNLV